MLWFSSDQHFGHKALTREHWHGEKGMRYFLYPDNVDAMNEDIIANHNTYVKPEDTIYYVGDFAFAKDSKMQEILSRLNGTKHLIRGNHDHDMNQVTRSMFASVQDYLELKLGPEYVPPPPGEKSQLIVLCHYPFAVWRNSHWGSWHLHGHSHGSHHGEGKKLDVGVDVHGMCPVSIEYVQLYMQRRHKFYDDYHKGEE